MTNPIKALIDVVRRRARASRARSEHMERIIERAREAMFAEYRVQRTEVVRLSKYPPPPMRHMPRPGPAWFLAFANPRVKGMLFVEVDDATEQVTRIWATPR
jgi:hypothetical protein